MFTSLNAMFSGLDLVFFVMAVFGGLLFVARMGLAMVGMGHHDISSDVSSDVSMEHDVTGGQDGDSGFNILTLQGLTVFFLMFGLVGLAMHRGSHLGEVISILGGLVAGVLMMAVLAKMVQMMMRLQSSGNANPDHAIGETGTVYLTIPADGTGQIQIGIDGRLLIYDAVAEDKGEVKTGDRVEVTRVLDGRLMVVRKS